MSTKENDIWNENMEELKAMTREDFDLLPTWDFMEHNKNVSCPDCGTKNEAPYPDCGCRSMTECKEYPRGYHIMKYHHECTK